jgi:serine/threonine protein kinase
MGTVYEALDQRLNTTVALKETHFTEERLSKQFEREAQLLARLRHPAMTRVIDHFTENDGQYLVMDYIAGEDLWEMIERRSGAFPVDDVLKWADQLLDALEYLHSQDPPVIHRDIKPQNLKLTGSGQIILLDFGLAKGFAGQISRVTTSGSIFGYTPNYAPLEQIHGTGTDARSDLYSLAATLYHLITGNAPAGALSRAMALANEQPDPLLLANEINAQVPAEVAEVLAEAMATNLAKRPTSAAQMRQRLDEVSPKHESTNSGLKETVLPSTIIKPSPTEVAQEEKAKPIALTIAESDYVQTLTKSSPMVSAATVASPTKSPDALAESISLIKGPQSFGFSEQPERKSKRGIWIVGALVVLIIIAGIVSISLYKKQTKSEETKDAPLTLTKPEKKKIGYVFVSSADLSDKIAISDEELRVYYNSIPTDQKQAGVQGQEIVLRIPNSNSEQQVLERANQIVVQLKKEGNQISEQAFNEIARGLSENPTTAIKGGKLAGLVRPNQNNTNDPFQKLFTLQPGEITEPIKYQNSYLILRRGEAVAKTFEEAKQELAVSLRNRLAYSVAAQVAKRISVDLKQTKDLQKTAQKFAAELNMDIKDMVRETPFIKPGDEIPNIGLSPKFDEGIASLKNVNDVGDVITVSNGFAVPILIEKQD